MNPTVRTAIAVVLVAIITVCAVLVFAHVAGRARLADLTEDKLYTLSDGTKRILAKLNQHITLKLFYSRVAARKGPEQIRYWNNYYLFVRDLLEEYVSRARGHLTLEVIDPRPFSDAEEEALKYGLERYQMDNEPFFFGLAATTELGRDEVIEIFKPDRQQFVEYDLSKTISSLMQREKKKIGIIASLPVTGTEMSPYMMQMMRMQGRGPEGPWPLVKHLRQSYEVESVKVEDDPVIPDDIDYLMVIHPKELDDKTQFAIDQYVMKGGKLMVFVDPHCRLDRPMMPQRNQFAAMGQKASSGLNDLLETWGVKMEPEAIAVDRKLALAVQMSRREAPVPMLPYIRLNSECVNPSEVVTANLHSIVMTFPGALSKVDGAATEVSPLLHTTDVGTTWKPSSPFELRFPDARKIREEVVDGTEPVMLACVIRGRLKTNFPDGFDVDAKEEDQDKGKEADKEEEDKEPEGKAAEPKPKAKAAEPKAPEPKAAEPKGPKAKPKPKAAEPKSGKAKAAEPKAAEPKAPKAKAPPPKTSHRGSSTPVAGGVRGASSAAAQGAAPKPKADKPAPPKAKAPKPKAAKAKAAEAPPAKPKGTPAEPKAPKAKAAKPKAGKPKAEPKAEAAKTEEQKKEEEPKKEEKKKRHIEAITEAAEGAVVIVVADVDVVTEGVAYRDHPLFGLGYMGDNAAFVLNALDYLGGTGDLIAIRSRGRYIRRFRVVKDIEDKAEEETAKEVKAINDEIKKYKEKRDNLGKAATDENLQLIQNTALAERRKIEGQIHKAEKRLRRLQDKKRKKVEALESNLQTWNMFAAPSIILLIAIVLALFRWIRAKHYAARRM